MPNAFDWPPWRFPMSEPMSAERLAEIEAHAEDATRNRNLYGKASRSRRITQELSALDVPALIAEVRRLQASAAERVRAAHQAHVCGASGYATCRYAFRRCTSVGTCDCCHAPWPCQTVAVLNEVEGECDCD